MTRRFSLLAVFVIPTAVWCGIGAAILVTLAGLAGWLLGIAEVATAMHSYRVTVHRREAPHGQ